MTNTNNSSFQPTASWDTLRRRAKLLQKLRQFFCDKNFLEVETPLLSGDTVIDRHLDPIPVTVFDDAKTPDIGRKMWLQTSPEFGMKRLLAAGAERIFQVARAFRAGEVGQLHNPEFTIVEWYRVGDSMQTGMHLLADLTCELLGSNEVNQVSYAEAFQIHVGVDAHQATTHELAECATASGLSVPNDMPHDDRDEWLNLLLATLVEPKLGIDKPEILYDYPASQAALAQVRNDDPPVAERFELYVDGVELANGYHELLDANVLRARNHMTNARRDSDGKYTLPEDSRLLDAMDHGLPSSVGVALGFDRLVMVATGAQSLHEVMAFPVERA